MRVLVLHSRYLSGSLSGENRVVDDEIRLLQEAGHNVVEQVVEPSDVSVASRARLGAHTIWSQSAAAAVRELVRRRRPDVVHFHNLFPALSPAAVRAASDVPTVMTLHNFRLLCLPATFVRDGRICESCLGKSPWRGIIHRCYRGSALGSSALAASLTLHRRLRSFEAVDRFLAVSEFVRGCHLTAGFPAERVHVKRNFAWPTERREGPGGYFLYLGRLSPEKGVGTLVDAWRTIRAPLVIAGDGPQASDLHRGAPDAVEIRGAIAPAEVVPLLRGARALLFPSTCYEGGPRSIIEAYAAGVPVIGSDIGGIPELIEHQVSGVLVRPRDGSGWASAVEALLDDSTSERLGAGAWCRWSRLYEPTRALSALEAIYAAVADLRTEPHDGPAEGERRSISPQQRAKKTA
jgi:glycosyltransferase involved in cell wall biosynthesis